LYGVEQLPVYWLAAVASAIVHNCNLWEWGITLVLLEMAWAGWPPVPERLLAAMARLARTSSPALRTR
jgi:hypothetical protein